MLKYTSPVQLSCYLKIIRKRTTNSLEIAALLGLILPPWKLIAYPALGAVARAYSAKLISQVKQFSVLKCNEYYLLCPLYFEAVV